MHTTCSLHVWTGIMHLQMWRPQEVQVVRVCVTHTHSWALQLMQSSHLKAASPPSCLLWCALIRTAFLEQLRDAVGNILHSLHPALGSCTVVRLYLHLQVQFSWIYSQIWLWVLIGQIPSIYSTYMSTLWSLFCIFHWSYTACTCMHGVCVTCDSLLLGRAVYTYSQTVHMSQETKQSCEWVSECDRLLEGLSLQIPTSFTIGMLILKALVVLLLQKMTKCTNCRSVPDTLWYVWSVYAYTKLLNGARLT